MPTEIHLKRLAIQVAAQLPEDHDQAMKVIDFVVELYATFFRVGEPADCANVAEFPRKNK
jgi:hypothetical protein